MNVDEIRVAKMIFNDHTFDIAVVHSKTNDENGPFFFATAFGPETCSEGANTPNLSGSGKSAFTRSDSNFCKIFEMSDPLDYEYSTITMNDISEIIKRYDYHMSRKLHKVNDKMGTFE